ncbi:MAG: HD domain-containing protein [Candidatus Gastranaerophilales bacterium]|nr:HD domain-containing protein [Candidatus Gastranaerophilales bacterium]
MLYLNSILETSLDNQKIQLETYIKNRLLNNPEITAELICKDELLYKNIKKWLKIKLNSEKHYIHSKSTAKCAFRFAEIVGENPYQAKLTALLHDNAKITGDNSNHANLGAKSVQDDLGLCNRKIFNAIKKHSFHNSYNTNFEKIIFLADKTDPAKREKGLYETALILLSEGVDIHKVVKMLKLD